MTYVVGIAGGTGSGKTALTRILHEQFAPNASSMTHDNYYRRQDDLSFEERCKVNYDHPSAFDNDLLVAHLDELLSGRAIESPRYDFANHNRADFTETVDPAPILFIEGLLLFADQRLRERCQLRIYVDTDADVRILRRAKRDVIERGRTFESVEQQYLNTVKPMHEQFVEATKHFADIIVPEGAHNLAAIEIIAGGLANVIEREAQTQLPLDA